MKKLRSVLVKRRARKVLPEALTEWQDWEDAVDREIYSYGTASRYTKDHVRFARARLIELVGRL